MTMHVLVRNDRNARRTALGLAAAATLTLTLAACSSGATSTAGSTTATVASTSAASSTTAAVSGGTSPTGAMNTAHNDSDATFAQQMIVHHQDAIDMADLAATRANSQQVKDLAAEIKAAQAPEIQQMTGMLQAWGAGMASTSMMSSAAGQLTSMMSSAVGMTGMGDEGDDVTGADGSGTQMPGMMTDDETAQLAAATGADFDRLFLQMMIIHHQGAVQTADTELAQGSDPDALALAESIKTGQTQEIATMQQLLTTL